MVYNNGDVYEGEWKKSMKEGKGIYYYKNGEEGSVYEGEFHEDKRHG